MDTANEINNNNDNNINKNQNQKEFKKAFLDKISDENSSLQENMNLNENNNKNLETDSINVIVDSSYLSDIKSLYGNTLSKNEYIFSSINSIRSSFSLSKKEKEKEKENIDENIVNSQIIKSNKKILKNNEQIQSNVCSTANISSFEKPPIRCTCKNSNCLKFYCDCFSNGRFCDNCVCTNCKNTQENKDLRLEKYKLIISRNPKALQKINSKKRSWTCKCRNSNCTKKYCDCYQNKRFCTSKCRCINCLNKNMGGKPNNNNNNKMKRIRGIKREKMNNLIIKRKFRRNNKIITKNENKVSNNKEENKNVKEQMINYYTPKKQRNHLDRNDIYIYDKKESTTATIKRERRKFFENINNSNAYTEKKRKDVYTKLKMDG